VLNTYEVLLTRGMLGATVYSTDAETQALLESLIPAGRRHDRRLVRTLESCT